MDHAVNREKKALGWTKRLRSGACWVAEDSKKSFDSSISYSLYSAISSLSSVRPSFSIKSRLRYTPMLSRAFSKAATSAEVNWSSAAEAGVNTLALK
jgi:hypothetical protein